MTERTSWKGSARRSLRNCIVPIAAALLILMVPAALATPEPAYNLVWGQTPAGSFVGTNAPLGLKLIEIDGAITDATVAQVQALMASPDKRRAWARHNFEIAKERLSYRVLRRKLRRLMD